MEELASGFIPIGADRGIRHRQHVKTGLSLLDVFRRPATAKQAIVRSQCGYDMMTSCDELAGIEAELMGKAVGRETVLRKALATLEGAYDMAVIDCPPGLGLLSINALVASSHVLIPASAELFSLHGVASLLDTIAELQEHGYDTKVCGIVATMYDARKRIHRDALHELSTAYGQTVFDVTIRQNIALTDAATAALPIYSTAPNSHGAQDYEELTAQILHRMKKHG